MAQFTTPPAIDGFETTLAQAWNWLVGTIFVDAIPNATLSGWDKTYVVVNPWKTTQQVARISAWSTGQLTCDSVAVKKWAGTNYTSTTHAVKSKVIITDVYQTWEDIETAVNSKADTSNPTFTTMITGPVYASLSALTTAYPTPTNGQQSVFCTLEWQYYDAQWWSRQPRANGVNPNASTTAAGKVEKATPAEVTAGTAIGWTGAELFVWPAELKTVTDVINTSIAAVSSSVTNIGTKSLTLWETISARDNVCLLQNNLAYKYIWDGVLTWNGFTWIITSSRTMRLSDTSFVQFQSGNAWAISVVVWTISWNTITYWTVNTFTPSSRSIWRWTPSICVLSSTSFVVSYWYTWFSGWNSEFLQAVAYTTAGTVITRWATLTITNDANPQTVSSMCFVDTNKFAISYNRGIGDLVACTVSWTTITAWTPVWSLNSFWDAVYVSANKIAINNSTNTRLYTFSWTTPTEGNVLANWATYSPFSFKDLWSWLSIVTGTTWWNTQAFIVDCNWTTPTKWTTVTVLASSTSNDWISNWLNQVLVVTWWNKYYYYIYTGTTLTAIRNNTNVSIIKNWIDTIWQEKFIMLSWSNWQLISNMKYYAIWSLRTAWVLNDVRPVVINGWENTWYTWLIPWSQYSSNSLWATTLIGDYIIGKASSTTTLLVWIPYNIL